MSLAKYNEKRDFTKTREPKGEKRDLKSLRFVVQYHEARRNHYDFRLEHDGVLLSFAVPKGISTNPKIKRLAVRVEDHPVDYIDFEGIIPKGNYGAGTVEIFDRGEYLPMKNFNDGLKKGHLKFVLNGEKLKGAWNLIKTDDKNWIILKIDDKYSGEERKSSFKIPFKTIDVELATRVKEVPRGESWIFEIKYDGYRVVSFVEDGQVRMMTRNKVDYTSKFKEIEHSLKNINKHSFVVDGEVVAFNEFGRSDFGLLQENLKCKKGRLFYVLFDLLFLDGEDLRGLPLEKRKEKLERLLFKAGDNLVFSTHVLDGEESFRFAKENRLEGIVAKNKTSKYKSGRTADWLKIKCVNRQEFVVAGYTTSLNNEVLSALILGVYENGELKCVGKVGVGFSEKCKQELREEFKNLEKKTSPFKEKLRVQDVVWLTPRLVAEVTYAEVTREGVLRQPVFEGLRKDKSANDVVWEKV